METLAIFLTETEFTNLPTYQFSNPTLLYNGRRWKMLKDDIWIMVEVISDSYDNYSGLHLWNLKYTPIVVYI